MKKGYVLTMDAIVALVLATMVFVAVLGMHESIRNTEKTGFKKIHYTSEDAIEVLNKKGVLDQVCTEWAMADNNKTSPNWIAAESTAKQHLSQIIPERMGYRLLIDGVEICNDSRVPEEVASAKTHSTRILSGYLPGMPPRAYVARAGLSNIRGKKASTYVYFGGYEGDGNITKKITLPDDANVSGARIELTVGNDFDLYVNDNFCRGVSITQTNMSANVDENISCGFNPGENTLELRFPASNNSFIGGGYIRVDYTTAMYGTIPDQSTYQFPGINGIINLYSSFYVPGPITSMEAYLHYNNNITNATVYLTIANTTIFSSSDTGEQIITFTDDNLTALDYSMLGMKTIPIRLGTEIGNATILTNGTFDVVLVTDTSGSMEFCSEGQDEGCCQMVPDTCSVGNCSLEDRTWNDTDIWEEKRLLVHGYRWNSSCGVVEKKIDIAKNASKAFVDDTLSNPGSRIGLVDYSSSLIVETVPRPNLQVTDLTFSDHLSNPGIVGYNEPVEICYNITNLGYGPIPSPFSPFGNVSYVNTRFYLDNGTNRWEVANDDSLARVGDLVYGMDAGKCGTEIWSWNPDQKHLGFIYPITFNATYPPGNYSLIAVVDADDDHLECNESDNEFSVDLTIRPAMPDLIITDLWIDHFEPTPGNYDFVINATVKNQGSGAVVTPFNVSFYKNVAIEANKIGYAEITSVGAWETENAVFTWNPAFAEVCGGPINIIAWADYPPYSGVIGEVWDDNNNRTIEGGLSDLEVTSFSISPTLDGPNKTIKAFFRVDNTGFGYSGPFNISIYVSNATDTWEVDKSRLWLTYPVFCDFMKGIRSNNYFETYEFNDYCKWGDLCGGGYALWNDSTLCFEFEAPMTPGNYVVTIVADSDDEVPECDETDNTRTAALTVRPAAIDIVVTELTGLSSTVINYTVTMENTGELDTGQFDVDFYNDILNPANKIGTVTINNINAYGGTTTASVIWAPTQNELCNNPGAVIVRADSNNNVIELDETNNQESTNDPDIKIISIDFFPVTEAEVYNGSDTFILFKVKNTGGTNLHTFNITFYYGNGTKIGSLKVREPWRGTEENCGIHPDHTYRTYTNYNGLKWKCFELVGPIDSHSGCSTGSSNEHFNFTTPGTVDNYTIIARVGEANEIWECKDDNEISATLEVKERPAEGAVPPTIPIDPLLPYIIFLFLLLALGLVAARDERIQINRAVLTSFTLISFISIIALTTISEDILCEPAETITLFNDSITGVVNLTNDAGVLKDHIDRIETWNLTCICCGVNKAVEMLNDSNSTKIIIVMSDGVANVKCPEQNTGDAKNDSIKAAQDACANNISVYAVGFGTDADEVTLKAMACNESMYYNSTDAHQLMDIYKNISEQIEGIATMAAQTIVATENISRNNTLYLDSYIKLYYAPTIEIEYGGVFLTLESPAFGNNITTGSFTVPNGTRPVDAKITSYSAEYWTDWLDVRNITGGWIPVYRLGEYGDNYIPLGDPYTVNIPVDYLSVGDNQISIAAGTSPTDYVGGSPDDKAIYTVAMKTSSGYGQPKPERDGCNWLVEFYDNSMSLIKIPPGYIGGESCNYTNANIAYNNQSAVSDVIYRLFKQLDVYPKDGRLDVKFDSDHIKADTSTVGGVRSLWGPVEVKLVVWMN